MRLSEKQKIFLVYLGYLLFMLNSSVAAANLENPFSVIAMISMLVTPIAFIIWLIYKIVNPADSQALAVIKGGLIGSLTIFLGSLLWNIAVWKLRFPITPYYVYTDLIRWALIAFPASALVALEIKILKTRKQVKTKKRK